MAKKYLGEQGGKRIAKNLLGLYETADHDEVDKLYEQYVGSVLATLTAELRTKESLCTTPEN